MIINIFNRIATNSDVSSIIRTFNYGPALKVKHPWVQRVRKTIKQSEGNSYTFNTIIIRSKEL